MMRDAIEIFEFADHGRAWSEWVHNAFHKLHLALRWAGAAFAARGLRRTG